MSEVKKLGLENKDGVVVRAMAWPASEAESATLVKRHDTKRLELLASVQGLKNQKIGYDTLAVIERAAVASAPVAIEGIGRLVAMSSDAVTLKNEVVSAENDKNWRLSVSAVALGAIVFLSIVMTRPLENAKLEQQLKQQVVQIVKNIPVKPQPVQQAVSKTVETTQTVKPTNKTATIKRMGALAVLGSLKTGSQKGGLNLGAVNTTAGPGLGGTGGSGGAQTSIYAKGLVAAPLGAGGNMQGGGGYGTKGKGGGQAGYGKLSLVGSAGTSPIPLGREAIIEGGLDRDLIADVVNRNMGQIRFCYEQGLQGDPALAGRVAIGWIIGGNGQVKTASVESTTLNSKLVEDCILLRLRTWKFPLPDGGSDVKVSFPFVLRRTGQG
ncbi:MAG: AgmX/PglI C-terminal domain-containing protein [Bdellovibrionales bacterium]|nr:AgmX/PglI C-terminal domain-containing protein [Bdellovibrionales bacterium]